MHVRTMICCVYRISFLHFKYSTVAIIDKVNAPLLLLHGLQDYKVPIGNSHRLRHALLKSNSFFETDFLNTSLTCSNFQACASKESFPIQLKSFPHANHDNIARAPDWVPLIKAFVKYVESSYRIGQ